MTTLAELNSLGDTATVVSSPLAEPLNAPLRFEERLRRFGEHYNTGQDSHLYKLLVSLCGDAGAGSLKREKLYPRLQQLLGSTYFQDIDKLYGNPIGISRLPIELYIFDPHNEALTQEQWIEVFGKDASYRERCLTWMRAIIEGPTPRGIALAAEAACGIECDVYENYNYIDNIQLARHSKMSIEGNAINWLTRYEGIRGDGIAVETSYGSWPITNNACTNGSFEQGLTGWSTATSSAITTGATATISDSEYKYAHSVSMDSDYVINYIAGKSLHLVGSSANHGIQFKTADPINAMTYIATLWIKRVGSSGDVTLFLGEAQSGTGTFNTAATITPTTTWTKYTVTWTADASTMAVGVRQQGVTAMDIYIDGVMIEAATPIPSPFFPSTDGTRVPTDIRLPNPDTKLDFNQGWIAIKVKEDWPLGYGQDDFGSLGNDIPHLWSWRGEESTMRCYYEPVANVWKFERFNNINPVVESVTLATSANPETIVCTWNNSNLKITRSSGASSSTAGATAVNPIYGGNFYIGNDQGVDHFQGNIHSFATGKTYDPVAADIVTLLSTDTPDLTDFPTGTTSFWNCTDENYYSTGSDIATSFTTPALTESRNEFIIIPQVTDLTQQEKRAIIRLVDKLRPVNTIVTVSPGTAIRTEIPILDVGASSTRFNVLRQVTGNTNITWPALDPAAGYWIDENTNEAPTFAFLDRQETATYITIKDVTASSEHIGQFNSFQKSLFTHLNNLNDLTVFDRANIYAKAVAPLNITTPWIKTSSKEKILVNNYYPLGYFTQLNTEIAVAENSFDFWASAEKYAPSSEEVIINLDVTRPFNFIDFNISQKPVDILIEYNDNGNWVEIEPKEGYEFNNRIEYLPSVSNPWAYLEYNFNLISTDKIKLTFTRRDETFPDGNTQDYPWSIEVQNLRVIHLIQTIDDFVIDSGTDILGNMFETEIFEYEVANVIDPDDPGLYSYWQSQPNPTRHAVEALYFDLRDSSVVFTMAELNGDQMEILDERSVNELTNYWSSSVLVDEVYINPITHGPDMHFYYSLDDTPDWDDKLWIPIPKHYKLRKSNFALPLTTAVKYFKIEFSDLAPIPYQFIEYPVNITTKFRRYPTWVQNYFAEIYPTKPYEENIEVTDVIKVDPLKYGYKQYLDALNTGYKDVRAELFKDTSEEVREFIEDVIEGGLSSIDTNEVENKIRFFNPLMWQRDLLSLLDPTRAATRRVQQLINPLINEVEWSTELALPTYTPPVQKSMPSLADSAEEKQKPIMWFPRTARHGYQLVEARFDNKVAYHVAIQDVKFLRRDLSVKYDEEIYYETLEDEAHISFNNLSQLDTYRWGVA